MPGDIGLRLGARDRLADDCFFYFDDVDWCFRTRLGGGRIGIVPDARVDHLCDFMKRRVKWRLLERNRWATVIRTIRANCSCSCCRRSS